MTVAPDAASLPRGCTTPPPRVVVAVILSWRGNTALLKRSQWVGHDKGRWHCVTGFVDQPATPYEQALTELHEETGLRAADLVSLRPGPMLELDDAQGNTWQVHTFAAETVEGRLVLNDEHEAYRWVPVHRVARIARRVGWLDDVLAAVG